MNPRRAVWLLEDLVKTKIQSLSFLATLAVVLGLISGGSALNAQTTPSTPTDQQTTQPTATPATPPTQQTPQTQPAPTPDNPPATQQTPNAQTPNAQTPDAAQPSAPKDTTPTAATPSTGDSQVFAGTVEKSGDKYVLKTDSGKTYDIDHQDDVKKFEGKRVRVQGKLDESGTKIQVK
jgi:outer membrane biosynthesis protein TonB